MSPRRVLAPALAAVLALSAASCAQDAAPAPSPAAASSTTTGPEIGTVGRWAPSGYTADVGPWKVTVETLATGDEATKRLEQQGYSTSGMRVGTYVLLRVQLQNGSGQGSQQALAESFRFGVPSASDGSIPPARPLTLPSYSSLHDLREAPENYATGTTTGYVLFDAFGPDYATGEAVILDPGGSDNVVVWAVDW